MKKILISAALLAPLALATAYAGGATTRPAATQQRQTYVCDSGQRITVNYVNVSPDAPTMVVITYKNNQYALAPAVSASGARFVGLAGLNTASGLEWTEHQGEGYLSSFPVDDPSKTSTLLTCKLN